MKLREGRRLTVACQRLLAKTFIAAATRPGTPPLNAAALSGISVYASFLAGEEVDWSAFPEVQAALERALAPPVAVPDVLPLFDRAKKRKAVRA